MIELSTLDRKMQKFDIDRYGAISQRLQKSRNGVYNLPQPPEFENVFFSVDRKGSHRFESELERIGWLMIGAFHEGQQKNELGLTRHSFDAAFKFYARNVCDLLVYDVATLLLHDVPEDILKVAKGHVNLSPLAAAHVTLHFLASVAGEDIVYGLPVNGGRVGGVRTATNFFNLAAGPVLDEIVESESFTEIRPAEGLPITLTPGNFIFLTDRGRKHFTDSMTKYYGGRRINSDEIVAVYDFIRQRYKNLEARIDREGWDSGSSAKIRNYAESFIQVIDGLKKGGRILDSKTIGQMQEDNYLSANALVANPMNERPADESLLVDKSPFKTTVGKTCYNGYISSIGSAVRQLFEDEYARKSGLYLSPATEKNSDASETISTITPPIEPRLPQIASINRKAKVLAIENASLLGYLTDTKHAAPQKDVKKLYGMSDYMLNLLGKRLRKMYKVSKGERESATQDAAETFRIMSGKVDVYRRELRNYMPGFIRGLRRYVPLI